MKTKLVDLMMALGMNRTMATMSLPMMWVTPAIADRYSNSTIEIVKTLQRHFGLEPTGQVCAGLATALESCCGRAWQTMTWTKIYRTVAAHGGRPVRKPSLLGMGADDDVPWWQKLWGVPETLIEQASLLSEPWCSTAHPNGNCRPISGVCKPMTGAAANLYKNLQTQLNRCAYKGGFPRIAVDGRPGRQTVALVNKVFGSTYSTCDQVCANATSLAQQAKQIADTRGAPAVVPAPAPTAPPSVSLPDGTVRNPATAGFGSLDQILGFATSPFGLLLIGGFAAWKGGLFNGTTKKKRKPAKKKRRTAKKRKPAKKRRR